MKFSGNRLEWLKRAIGGKTHEPMDFKYDSKKGASKEVIPLNNRWVIKMFKPDNFSSLEGNYLPGSQDWANKGKLIVEAHTNFITRIFGEIYDIPRIFIADTERSNGRKVKMVYKIQRNRSLNIIDTKNEKKVEYDPRNWKKLISEQENSELRKDFERLYFGWKKLKSYGLCLDIYPDGNITIVKDEKTGRPRLKIYDAIPLYLTDNVLYSESQKHDVPQNLLTLSVEDDSAMIKGHINSEFFFQDLETFIRNQKT